MASYSVPVRQCDRVWRPCRRRARQLEPQLEPLEDRLVLSGTSSAFFTALTTDRYWVDYAPSYTSANAPYNSNPSDAQITKDLTTLYNEGWRGLVTYTLSGTYADIPKIAKSVGFLWVIAGIYNPNDASEVAEAWSPNVLPYTDAYVVGNEGLTDGSYTFSQLSSAISTVETMTGKPVTTSEPGGAYYTGSPYATQLLGLGDWLFPNIDYFLWNNQPSSPQFMWTNVSYVYQYMLQNQTTGGPVVAKEVFYPTAGGPEASNANQIAWYGQYAVPNLVDGHPFYFVWQEAFDQPWKISINSYEPNMGLHLIDLPDGTAQSKPIISQLQADYTGTYPATMSATSNTLSAPAFVSAEPITAGINNATRGAALFFSVPLNAGAADDTGNYSVSESLGKGRTKAVRVESANDVPSNSSVTLLLARTRPGQKLRLIASGLLGANGAPIAPIVTEIG